MPCIVALKTQHLREETIRRIDADLCKAVSQVSGGTVQKAAVSLTLTVEYDEDEGRVMVNYAHKAGSLQKGAFGIVRPDEQTFDFDEHAEDRANGHHPELAAPAALPQGEIIDADIVEDETADEEADGPEAAVPSGDR